MYNLPNILTLSRIAVIPLIFVSIYLTSYFWAMFAATLFVVASITDYLDGYLARARNETSAFGRLLDPIADKLLVATALVVILAKTYQTDCGSISNYYVWKGTIIAAFVILCREILVSGLREFLREVNVGLPVTKLAKWKTAFQMTALAMMLFRQLSMFWGYLGECLLWVAAILTFITGYQYYQKSLEYVKAEEAKKNKTTKTVTVVSEQKRIIAAVEAKTTENKKTTAARKTTATRKKTAGTKTTAKKKTAVKPVKKTTTKQKINKKTAEKA